MNVKSISPNFNFNIGLLEFILKLNYYFNYYFVYFLRKQNLIFCLLLFIISIPFFHFVLFCYMLFRLTLSLFQANENVSQN